MFKDLKGRRFGRLICIERAGRDERTRNVLWKCLCDCGNITTVLSTSLIKSTKSCGCLQKETARKQAISRTKHGLAHRGVKMPSIYKCWAHMKSRCSNENDKSYPDYGGRGINFCEEWTEFTSFHEWALNHGYRKGLTIERINVNGNYEPTNCKWIPKSEQNANKRTSHYITINGETKIVAEWAKIHNINSSTVFSRINSNWPIEKLFIPTRLQKVAQR